MDKFKEWYKEKKGKHILFFGFYLIFFIILAIYFRSIGNEPKEEPKKEEQKEEVIKTYDISNLINNDYEYEIIVTDNNSETTFKGSKTNVDYANFSNKYFLDIYNINQLLKRSKFISSKDNVLTYELTNKEINDILLTEREDGVNKIDVYVNEKDEVEKIVFDLSKYLDKEIYQIDINYTVGDNNENSSS